MVQGTCRFVGAGIVRPAACAGPPELAERHPDGIQVGRILRQIGSHSRRGILALHPNALSFEISRRSAPVKQFRLMVLFEPKRILFPFSHNGLHDPNVKSMRPSAIPLLLEPRSVKPLISFIVLIL